MNTNFNETFLDENSTLYNYYIGIPNIEINDLSQIENIIKKHKKINLDYLSINIFNFYMHQYIPKNSDTNLSEIINKIITNLSKKYRISFIFSYSISANPIGYFDCWNSHLLYKGDVKSIKDLIEYLIYDKSSFLSIKKPHRGILSLSQTPLLNQKLCSIEICNINNNSSITDYENIYYTLLDKNWTLGAISSYNSSDLCQWYTGIISHHSYTNMLIDSIRDKFTYSTKIPDLKLYFSVNFIPMGRTLKIDDLSAQLSFYIFAETHSKNIKCIEVLSSGKKIFHKIDTISLKRLHYVFQHEASQNETWFVVRILGENDVLAITSPVFVNYSKSTGN